MGIKEVMGRVYGCCKYSDPDGLQALIKHYPSDIDFEYYKNGALMLAAMNSSKPELLIKLLVDFYQKINIDIYQPSSHQYLFAQQKLGTMLEEAYSFSSTESDEIEAIISKYTLSQESTDSAKSEADDSEVLLVEDDESCMVEKGDSGLTYESLVAWNKSNPNTTQASAIEKWNVVDIAGSSDGDSVIGAVEIVWDE